MSAKTKPLTRPLYTIAAEIAADWPAVTNRGRGPMGVGQHPANPYFDAMQGLTSMTDKHGWESARSIVMYFLSNATTWRGETARRIKAELKAAL